MDTDLVYKRTYMALRIHAFRNNGYLTDQELETLHLPTTPDVLADVLAQLQADDLVKVNINLAAENITYDFLPLLEKAVAESLLDIDTRFQLAHIYLARELWTPAIAELRFTCTHPKFKKESLYLLGRCFEQKGAVERAREHYERLLAVDYDYQDAQARLTELSAQGAQPNQPTAIIPADTAFAAQPPLSQAFQERYEIVRELGRGGAGVAYQAIDLKLKRDVALKVFYRRANPTAEGQSDFLQEARLVAQLDHTNIIKVYDVNVADQCIAMEFVAGGTLRELLQKTPRLPLEQARGLIIQLCQGLQIAHEAGILHRDIKPENIFITKQKRVKLGDFGIAHVADGEADAFTHLAAQIGTLPYMSPEQVRGGKLTAASDIYAAGVVFYEMLTGAPPFMQGDLAYHHLYSAPPPPGIAPEIDAVLLRCLEKNPAQRFQSAEELRRLLQQQEKDARERFDQYRELVKLALVDKELNQSEIVVLKFKRQTLHLTDEEARQIEHEFGLTLPS